jgi:hypothetical protein
VELIQVFVMPETRHFQFFHLIGDNLKRDSWINRSAKQSNGVHILNFQTFDLLLHPVSQSNFMLEIAP